MKVVSKYSAQIENWTGLNSYPCITSRIIEGGVYYIKDIDWYSYNNDLEVFSDYSFEKSLGKYHRICFISINENRILVLNKILEE